MCCKNRSQKSPDRKNSIELKRPNLAKPAWSRVLQRGKKEQMQHFPFTTIFGCMIFSASKSLYINFVKRDYEIMSYLYLCIHICNISGDVSSLVSSSVGSIVAGENVLLGGEHNFRNLAAKASNRRDT